MFVWQLFLVFLAAYKVAPCKQQGGKVGAAHARSLAAACNRSTDPELNLGTPIISRRQFSTGFPLGLHCS